MQHHYMELEITYVLFNSFFYGCRRIMWVPFFSAVWQHFVTLAFMSLDKTQSPSTAVIWTVGFLSGICLGRVGWSGFGHSDRRYADDAAAMTGESI